MGSQIRILIFHGYLLAGTGSNVYNARLAQALVALGHEVHLLCQDRHPERQSFVDAVGEWDSGVLRVRAVREPPAQALPRPGIDRLGDRRGDAECEPHARCTVYRPNIGDLLPVYVEDRYEGIEARTFAQCSEAEIARYLDANVRAVRELAELVRPDIALANHLVMGPAILARALADSVPPDSATPDSVTPYAVKVHGSALEYTVKPDPERFLGYAREGLESAAGILVGSRHTARSLWQALGDPDIETRTRLGPPGVDVHRFRPRGRKEAAAGVRALSAKLSATAAPAPKGGDADAGDADVLARDAFARDDRAAAAALARLRPEQDRMVAFVGKLIVNKGVDLLIAAWPLVLEQVPDARLVIVGFGADRLWLEQLLDALAAGDLERAKDGALRHLRTFLQDLLGERSESGRRERYLAAARALPERAIFTGRLDHAELAELLPACEALVVPSTFPEAFGMVAAEGAACGALPVSAAHSGLAEVSEVLARAVPVEAARWLSFPVDDRVVPALAERIVGWLRADPALREQTRARLVDAVHERWSWEGVAQGVIAAASGELDKLARPEGRTPPAMSG